MMAAASFRHSSPDRAHKFFRRRKRQIFLGLGLGVLAGVAVWWGWDDSWRQVKKTGVIRVGYAIEAPYAFINPDGRVTGEGPEVARAVAQRLGLGEPEWVLTEFEALISELEAGRFDLIAAGMFITEERATRVAFSRPTTRVRPGLLVAKGNPRILHSDADAIKQPDVRLAALAGSVEAKRLTDAGLTTGRLALVPDIVSGLALLRSGRVDGLALSRPTVRWMARDETLRTWAETAEPFVAFAGGREEAQWVAMVFRRDARRLRESWNAELDAFMAGDDYRRIAREFGFTLPGPEDEK